MPDPCEVWVSIRGGPGGKKKFVVWKSASGMKLGGGRQPEEERERRELKGKKKKKSKLGSDVEGKKMI